MDETFDVIIVGAGPAGTSAACVLAGQGVKVIVLERGEYPGSKNISGGVLYGRDLANILPDFAELKPPIERNIVESRVWYLSKEGGYSLGYRDAVFEDERRYNAFTVGRAKFDRWFAQQAVKKGALLVSSTVVTDLLRDSGGRVVGVDTDRPDGKIRGKVVLLADGVNSPLAKTTGFRPEPRARDVALAVKEVMELSEEVINERFNVRSGDGVTTEIMGAVTGGLDGVAVIYTNKSTLSLCVGANLEQLSKTRTRPLDLLESFKEHPMVAPLIAGGKPVEYLAHWLPEGGYDKVPPLYGDGYLIAGDSAMLFNTLHREGSNMAMASGKRAAETILEALGKNDFTSRALRSYADRLRSTFVMKDMKKYRRFNPFLYEHTELFTTLPSALGNAAREMLTVNGVPKKRKQKMIWKNLRKRITPLGILKLLWDGWRAVR